MATRLPARSAPYDAEMPIIALTADADAIEKSLAAGMNAHLNKPIDIRQLKALLRRFLLQ